VVEEVHTYYGNIHALQGISLRVGRGEIVCLIGANGAGKSTALRTISGLLRARTGRIVFDGRDVAGVEAHELVAAGLGHAPEGRRIFATLSVHENLLMGAYTGRGKTSSDLERVYSLFPILRERARQLGGTLSGGEQQMLAIGRALMSAPRLLLLDEPSMGLAPILVKQIFGIIREIHRQGTSILLVEQNALQALRVAQRGYVLQGGRIVLADTTAALREDATVQYAYLGEGARLAQSAVARPTGGVA